jgi:hypothetical protein
MMILKPNGIILSLYAEFKLADRKGARLPVNFRLKRKERTRKSLLFPDRVFFPARN